MRVVNVVDLMTLFSPEGHPHGMSDARFRELFMTTTFAMVVLNGMSRFHLAAEALKRPFLFAWRKVRAPWGRRAPLTRPGHA